ncbi:MAG: GGDEF domain-containing protein, partial [Candidatus ainarchaeum sp.]|nr:GGDEF domain-containing protein [Candidatus ainarchaeum sp.]
MPNPAQRKPVPRFSQRGRFYVPKQASIKPLERGIFRLRRAYEYNEKQVTKRIAQLVKIKNKTASSNMPEAKKARTLALLDNGIRNLGQEKGRLISKFERAYEPLAEEAIRRLKSHPDYPAVYSKRYFIEEVRDSLLKPGTHSVGMLDIDRLNKFLAKHYHQSTGRVVSIFTESVAEVLGSRGGFACLYGGDEVGIFLPTTGEEIAHLMKELIVVFRKKLNTSEFASIAHTPEVQNLAFSGVFRDFSWSKLEGHTEAMSLLLSFPGKKLNAEN